MDEILRIILPIYFTIYFGLTFVIKSLVVARRIGKNPLVLPKDDSAYGLIGLYFKLTLIAIFIYTLIYALIPTWYYNFLPISSLDSININFIGLGFLIFSLVWTIIAQFHMENSWRIGIDLETKAKLVTNGLFSFSRNPIFFGMILQDK